MMNNASSLTDDQIRQMLSERGLSSAAPSQAAQPKLSDDQIRQMMQARGLSKQPQHFTLPGLLKSGVQDILNVGGGVAQGAESAIAGLENLPRDVGLLGRYFGVPGVQRLANLPAVHAMPAPFAQQQALTTQIPQAATEALGTLATGGAAGIRGAGEVAGALGRGTGRLAQRIGEPIAKKLAPITGRTAKETAVNYFNDISQGKPLAKLHTPLNDNINIMHKNARKATNVNYNYVKDLAREFGFTDDARMNINDGPAHGIDAGKDVNGKDIEFEGGEAIVPRKSLTLMNKLEPSTTEIKGQIVDFLNNPSFSKAHDLQGELNRENIRMHHSIRPGDREKAFSFRQARDALKDDITDSIDNAMKDSGGKGEILKKAYSDAAKFHLKEVVPFYDDKLIADMVLSKPGVKQNPEGIFNLLKKESDSTKFIKKRLSPESRDLFVANGLQRAFRRRGGVLSVTSPEQFLSKYDELESKGLNEFVNEEHDINRDKVAQQYKLSKSLRKYGKWAAKLATGSAIVGGAGKMAWDTF